MKPLPRLLALLLLAGCQPLLSGGFDTAAGGPAKTAGLAKMRNPAIPATTTTTVDNPFWCPKASR